MKLIEWNCFQSFRTKHERILRLKPDLLVVCECEDQERLQFGKLTPKPTDFIWHGELPAKGLGVFSYSNYTLEVIPQFNPEFKFIVPIRVSKDDQSFILMAVWTQAEKGSGSRYIQHLWNAVNHYSALLDEDIIIVGDLNSNVQWDKDYRTGSHSEVVELLEQKNIHSLYHHFLGLPQGNEPDPTFYMYRHNDKPFHIDYCFANKSLLTENFNLEVGKHEDWCDLSDHVPLIVNL